MTKTIWIWTLALVFIGCNVAEQTAVPLNDQKSDLSSTENSPQGYFRFMNAGLQLPENHPHPVSMGLVRGLSQSSRAETVFLRVSGNADLADIGPITRHGEVIPTEGNILRVDFAPGEVNTTLQFNIIDDDIYEPNERLTFSIAHDLMQGAGVRDIPHFHLLIENNDPIPAPTFASPASIVAEGATKRIPVRLTNPSWQETRALVKIIGGNADELDHAFEPTTVVFPPGVVEGDVFVPTVADGIAELDETLELEILPLSGLEYPQADNRHTLTIAAAGTHPSFGFIRSSDTLSEGASTMITVQFSQSFDRDVYLPFEISGNARFGEDYALSAKSFFLPQGQSSASIEFTAINDGVYEGTEEAVFKIRDQEFALAGPMDEVVVTIQDVQPPVSLGFSSPEYQTTEGTIVYLPIELSAPAAEHIKVEFSLGGSAVKGEDYATGYIDSFVIPAHTTLARFPISVFEDDILENVETVHVTLLSAKFEGSSLPDPAITRPATTLNILDQGSLPALSFASAKQTVSETSGVAMVQVNLDRPTQKDVSFSLSLGGDAVKGEDYGAIATTYTIPAGALSSSFAVPIIDDDVWSGHKRLVLSLIRPPQGLLGAVSTHEITIVDNDPKSRVSNFAIQHASINEGEQTFMEIHLDRPASEDLHIGFQISGPAEEGIDYVLSEPSFFAPKGATTARVMIRALNDGIHDGQAEVLSIVLRPGENYVLGAMTLVNLAIQDFQGPPELSFVGGSLVPVYEGSTVQLELQLNRPTHEDVHIRILADDNYAGNCNAACATVLAPGAPSHYDTDLTSRLDGNILHATIPKGETSYLLVFTALQDLVNEPSDERFKLSLIGVDGPAVVSSSHNEVEISIREVTSADIRVDVFASTTSAGEGDAVWFEAILSKPNDTGSDLIIPASFSSNATLGKDFAAGGQFIASPGSDRARLYVYTIDDGVYEGPEPESIQVNLASGAGYWVDKASASIELIDAQTKPSLSWSQAGQISSVEGVEIHLNLELDTASYRDVKAFIQIDDSYGVKCGAVCAQVLSPPYDTSLNEHPDFTKGGIISVLIPAGEKRAGLSFRLHENKDDTANPGDPEPEERFKLTIANIDDSDAADINAAAAEAEIVILSPEAGDIMASSSPSSAIVAEGELAWFEVRLSEAAPSGGLSFNYHFSGPAVQGVDFEATTSPLTIPEGEKLGRVYINALTDGVFNQDSFKEVQINFTGPAGYSWTQSSSSLWIQDLESVPSAGWSRHAVVEQSYEGATLRWEVELDRPTYANTVFSIDLQSELGAADSDDLTFPSSVTIPAGQTRASVNIGLVADSLLEDPEGFTLALTGVNSPAARIDEAGSRKSGVIYDNPGTLPLLSVMALTPAIVEGDDATFSISLDQSLASDLTVNYTWNGNAETLTIPSGEDTVYRTFEIAEDGVFRGLEPRAIILNLEASGAYSIGNREARIDIHDSLTAPKLSLRVDGSAQVEEGFTAVLEVELEHPVSSDLEVEIMIEDRFTLDCEAGCAQVVGTEADVDFEGHPNYAGNRILKLLILEGNVAASLSFVPIEDWRIEGEETLRFVARSVNRPDLAHIDPSNNEAVVTILDPPKLSVTVDEFVTEGNTATLEVTLERLLDEDLEVVVRIEDNAVLSCAEGCAEIALDSDIHLSPEYDAGSQTLTLLIPASSLSASFSFQAFDDDLPEVDEILRFVLLSVDRPDLIHFDPEASEAVITIQDP